MPRYGSFHRLRNIDAGGGGGGGGGLVITLTDHSVYKSGLSPQTASYSVKSDGKVTKNPAGTFIENWINQPSYVANYEVRAVLTSGTTPEGSALDTWLNLGISRTWSLLEAGGSAACVLTVSIRDVATSTTQAVASIDINVLGA